MHFSDGAETRELEDYRPISPLVVLACVAGLASLLAILHPLLWIIPVVAVILSICAILQVSAPHSRSGGRLGAAAALCLAVLIGTYAPARAVSIEYALYTRAQEQAKKWISLVQHGRYQEAHQFTLIPSDRFQGPGALADYYLPPSPTGRRSSDSEDAGSAELAEGLLEPPASQKLADFLGDPVIAKLIELGQPSSVVHLQNISIKTPYGGTKVTQRFRVSGVHAGQPESIEFFVSSTRWDGVDGLANWQCHEFKEAN
jgi:hypothetical protein